MRNLAIAIRTLFKRPGFALLAILTLAVGISTASVVFSICDAVFLKPLAVRAPEELVAVTQHLPRVGVNNFLPYSSYQVLHDHATMLSSVFGETGEDSYFVVTSPAPLDAVMVSAVTPDFFTELGVQPLYGRVLLQRDAAEQPDMPPAVLSYNFWQKHFAGDPTIVNRDSITLNGHHFLIVGVMPRGFQGFFAASSPDIRVPLSTWPALANVKPDDILLEMAARLKKGVSRQQAEAECQGIARASIEEYLMRVQRLSPGEMKVFLSHPVYFDSLEHGISRISARYSSVLKVVAICSVLVLLTVCMNVAGILLLRLEGRRHELAVRLAVGGSRLHIMREVITENLILAICATITGVGLAVILMPLAVRLLPPTRSVSSSLVSIATDIGLSKRAFLIVAITATLTMVLSSIGPVIFVWRSNLSNMLRASRTSTSIRGRQILIAGQIGLCTLVLALANLFARTVHELEQTSPGFDVAHIATFTGDLSQVGNGSGFVKQLLEQVREIPGVLSAGISAKGVMRGSGLAMTIAPEGERITSADFLDASVNRVTRDYFDALGLPIISGRSFRPVDEPSSNQLSSSDAIVNQAFVERFFPKGQVLGKRFGGGATGIATGQYEVIGVIRNAKYRTLREAAAPTFYTLQNDYSSFVLNVRTARQSESVIDPVRKIWGNVGSNVPLLEVHTMAEEVETSTSGERLTAGVASLFGAVAMFLVAVGLYGVLAYFVGQRRREIAIRMAVGGNKVAISRLILKQTLLLLVPSVCLGIVAALAAAPVYRSLLYEVAPVDPRSLSVSAIFMLMVGILATCFPTYQATQIDPAEELKRDI